MALPYLCRFQFGYHINNHIGRDGGAMRSIYLLVYLLFLGLLAPVTAGAQTLIRGMEGVTEYRLNNGLQVLLAPNDLHTRTHAHLVVKAGSAVEGFGEGGMAHLLEHMVFKGTPTTRDPMKEFSDRVLRTNGFTDYDSTNYHASMNPDAENLRWYLGWLADAMVNSFIAKQDLDLEMGVVRNEFERAATYPDGAVHDAGMALAFPNHGYGRPVIGIQSNIENINIERLQAFYKTWYRPDNMVLVVAGRFDAAAVLAYIQSVFGPLTNPSSPLPSIYTREPVQQGVREAIIRRVGSAPTMLVGWRGVPHAHPDDAVLDILAHTLVSTGGGRFRVDFENQGWGSSPWAMHRSMRQEGAFVIGAQLRDAEVRDQVQAMVLRHIAAIVQNGITPQELEEGRRALENFQAQAITSAEAFGFSLAGAAAHGDWRLGFFYRDNLRAVSVADTQRVAKAYLVDANRVRVTFIPEDHPVRAPLPQAQDLGEYVAQAQTDASADKLPALARFEPTIAEIEKHTIRSKINGQLRVILLPRPAINDQFVGRLQLRWGNEQSLRGQGVAVHVGRLLLKGSITRTEKQIQSELEKLKSELQIFSDKDGLSVYFQTTRTHWPAFSKLLQDVLRNPAFEESSFLKWRQEIVGKLVEQQSDQDALVFNATNKLLARPHAIDDPRYVRSSEEELSQFRALQLEDVKRFWRQFAGASVGEFAAVGALDVVAVQRDLLRSFGDWQTPGGAESYARIPNPWFQYGVKSLEINTPDKPNSVRLMAKRIPVDPWSREGLAMQIASGIIGGGPSSRFFKEVREEKGLSYSVGAQLAPNDADAFLDFYIYGSFAPQNIAAFDTAMQGALKKISSQGLSSLELFFAKRTVAESIKQGLNSDHYMVDELLRAEEAALLGRERSAAWYEEKVSILQNLTIEEVDAAAKKLVDQSNMVVVTAGPSNK